MSDRRHRPGGTATAKKVLTWGAWGVLVLLLGANVAMYAFNKKEGEAESGGFLTPDLLQAAGLWISALAAMGLAVMGVYWSSKAYAESERSSLLWAKRGSIFALAGALVFLMTIFDAENFPRDRLAVVAMFLLAGQTAFVAMLAFREFKRSADGEPGGRRGRRGATDTPLMDVPGAPAETPRA